MNKNNTTSEVNGIKEVKRFLSLPLGGVFFQGIYPQSRYGSGDIISVIRNATSSKGYIEIYVKSST
jgi:hypothetical protein